MPRLLAAFAALFLLFAAIVVAPSACSRFGRLPNEHLVSWQSAHLMVAAGARLVDVRPASEYAESHLPGAVNIPVTELAKRLDELRPTNRVILVYCRTGRRSAQAAGFLRTLGFTSVHDFGPMIRW